MKVTSSHHSFDKNLAAKFSIEEALLIHHFKHWIEYNHALKRNLIEGRTWSYQTQEEIAAHFPYFSKHQIFRIIKKLLKKEILIKGNFNKSKYDQTAWYAFKNEDDFIEKLRNRNIENENPQNENREFATPIPYPKPDAISKEDREAAPPDPALFYFGEEKRIRMKMIDYESLVSRYGEPLILEYLKSLYRWSFDNESSFKKKKRHDLVIETWIERDRKKAIDNAASATKTDQKEKNDERLKLTEDFAKNRAESERLVKAWGFVKRSKNLKDDVLNISYTSHKIDFSFYDQETPKVVSVGFEQSHENFLEEIKPYLKIYHPSNL